MSHAPAPVVSRRAVLKGALGAAAMGVLGTDRAASRARDARGALPEYVVVGGGIYGTGLAWELGRRGARVLLVEADAVASGASGGVGRRGVRSNGRDVRQLPLMPIAQERWRHWAARLGGRRIFDRVGHLHLVESEADLAKAEAQRRLQEEHGVRTQLVEREQLRRLEPDLSERVIAALYSPDDGSSDHTATTHALARAARLEGARLRRGVKVVGIELAAGRATAVVTSQGERIGVGRELVLVANAGSAELLGAALGLHLPLFNVLPQVLVTAPFRRVRVRHVIGHFSRRLALKELPGRHLMITGGWLGRVNPETGRGETIDAQVAGNLAEAVAVYPRLAGVHLAHAVADRFESLTPDFLPIVDRPPGTSNVLVAAGPSGQGWAPAPAYVELIADWLVAGERPALLAPFNFARFAPASGG